jgi:peroxiredoxin
VNNKTTFLLTLTLILSVGLLMSGCSNDTETAENTQAAAQTSEQGGAVQGDLVVGPLKGNLAPNFNLKNIHGGTVELASLKGKAVLIDFWDTWCPPCRRALPHLQELSEAYAADLVVVGVAMGRDGEAKVKSYVEENNLDFTFVMADAPQYQVMRDFGGVQSIPTTFLVDREGVIRQIWTGAMPKAAYEEAVRQVIGVQG